MCKHKYFLLKSYQLSKLGNIIHTDVNTVRHLSYLLPQAIRFLLIFHIIDIFCNVECKFIMYTKHQ